MHVHLEGDNANFGTSFKVAAGNAAGQALVGIGFAAALMTVTIIAATVADVIERRQRPESRQGRVAE